MLQIQLLFKLIIVFVLKSTIIAKDNNIDFSDIFEM
jgi:hypothetical protein